MIITLYDTHYDLKGNECSAHFYAEWAKEAELITAYFVLTPGIQKFTTRGDQGEVFLNIKYGGLILLL